jgi:CheY-like chemotaxis protein
MPPQRKNGSRPAGDALEADVRGRYHAAMNSRWLLIGDTDYPEFRPAVRQLEREVSVVKAPTIAEATRLLADEKSVDWIVLAQRTPGEFVAEEVAKLQRRAPLARFIALLGSWCEGEMRTGRPIAGVTRVLWHQWPARFERLLPRIRSGQSNAWSLPATASPEEVLLADAAPQSHAAKRQAMDGVTVGVVSDCRRMAEWLVDACRSWGCHATWVSERENFDGVGVVICDGNDSTQMLERIKKLRTRWNVPIIAITNFARWEEHCALVDAGCEHVFNKPVSLSDLRHAIARAFPLAPSGRGPG